jgi:hypothetical protein
MCISTPRKHVNAGPILLGPVSTSTQSRPAPVFVLSAAGNHCEALNTKSRAGETPAVRRGTPAPADSVAGGFQSRKEIGALTLIGPHVPLYTRPSATGEGARVPANPWVRAAGAGTGLS